MQAPFIALQKTCALGKATSTYGKQISARRVRCTRLRHAAHTRVKEIIVGSCLGSPVVVDFLMMVVLSGAVPRFPGLRALSFCPPRHSLFGGQGESEAGGP